MMTHAFCLFRVLLNDSMTHGSKQTIFVTCVPAISFFFYWSVSAISEHYVCVYRLYTVYIHTHMHELITSFSALDEPHLSQVKV